MPGITGEERQTNTSVLQDWLVAIPIRMQSTLLIGLRGCDGHELPNAKALTRWLRGVTFKPGNPDNVREFMAAEPPEIVEKGPVARELERTPMHYYAHLMHALEVVAYRHPDPAIRQRAFDRFYGMCALLHLPIEACIKFEARLCTREWPGSRQPDTFADAIDMLGPFL